MTQVHQGTIETRPDKHGNLKYHVTTLDGKQLECWSLSGATFYCWVREAIVDGRKRGGFEA